MPVITVIIPVYNSEKYLHQCVDSILAQTFTEFELLLIDDGSEDSSGKICDYYSAKDSRARVFHKKNGGVSSARNLGLDIAEGKYLIFLDSDDYWLDNNILQVLLELAEQNCLDVVRGELVEVDAKGRCLKLSRHSSNRTQYDGQLLDSYTFYKEIVKEAYFSVLCLFRKDAIGNVRFNENRVFLEDAEFYLDLCLKPLRCMYVSQVFYAYRKHGNSVSVKYIPNKFRDALIFTLLCFEKSKNADNYKLAIAYKEEGIRNYLFDLKVLGESEHSYRKFQELFIFYDIYNIRRQVVKVVLEAHRYNYLLATLPLNVIVYYNRFLLKFKLRVISLLQKIGLYD